MLRAPALMLLNSVFVCHSDMFKEMAWKKKQKAAKAAWQALQGE